MKHSQRVVIPADHPALAGHFPGDPVVPAVVLLDAVREALEARVPGAAVTGIRFAKFNAALEAGREFELDLEASETLCEFRCRLGADIIASGEFVVAPEI